MIRRHLQNPLRDLHQTSLRFRLRCLDLSSFVVPCKAGYSCAWVKPNHTAVAVLAEGAGSAEEMVERAAEDREAEGAETAVAETAAAAAAVAEDSAVEVTEALVVKEASAAVVRAVAGAEMAAVAQVVAGAEMAAAVWAKEVEEKAAGTEAEDSGMCSFRQPRSTGYRHRR